MHNYCSKIIPFLQTISEFEDQYWRHVASTHNAELNLSTIVQGNFVHFSHDCYDAALALAFALDKTNSGEEC